MGGLYAILALFMSEGGLRLSIDIAVCLLMCLIAFYEKAEGIGRLPFLTVLFLLASTFLGGIMTAIFHLMNRANPPLDAFPQTNSIPLWLFALVTAFATGITWVGGRFLKRRAQISFAALEIRLGKRQASLCAMCDSGNLLRDPVSGKPIIIADVKTAAILLPADCENISEWTAETLSTLPTSISSRIRLIPTSTIHQNGILYAIRPDQITIRASARVKQADALIGFADLSGTPKGCNAILPTDLLT